MRDFLWAALGILLFIAVAVVAVNEMNIAGIKFWGVRTQDAKTQVFKATQAYTQGVENDLADMRLEYMKADDLEVKGVLKATILHRFAGYDSHKLPVYLQTFMRGLRNE